MLDDPEAEGEESILASAQRMQSIYIRACAMAKEQGKPEPTEEEFRELVRAGLGGDY